MDKFIKALNVTHQQDLAELLKTRREARQSTNITAQAQPDDENSRQVFLQCSETFKIKNEIF
jgi:hypothetical protein